MGKPPLLTRPTGRRGISKNPRVRKACHIAVITAKVELLPSLRLPRESRLAPQHPRPIADLRLCAPPPEHRRVSTAPANRSRPPSPPCSYPALRLLSACPLRLYRSTCCLAPPSPVFQPILAHPLQDAVGEYRLQRAPNHRLASKAAGPRSAAFLLCKSARL